MTAEQILRDQLDRATSDVRGRPDLEAAVHRGRRQRQQRRTAAAVGAVLVAGVAGAGIHASTDGGVSTVTQDPAGAPAAARETARATAPASATASGRASGRGRTDFVPGTDTDTRLAAVIASHLPSLPAPTDVYPSDSHTAGPIPDQDFARAEDWQATYSLGRGHRLLVITSAPSEGGVQCPHCARRTVPGGTVYRQAFTSGGPDDWYFGVYFARPDGSAVNAFELVTAPTGRTASAGRRISDARLARLVQDRRLHFPS